MCWSTAQPPKRLIAEENIPIFKVCTESAIIHTVNSFFKYYKYKLNIVHKLTDKLYTYIVTDRTSAIHTCIDAGYHSYLTSKCSHIRDFEKRVTIIDSKGQPICSYGAYVLKVAGYIPKDSEYYINEQGECVSDSICLTKVEEW